MPPKHALAASLSVFPLARRESPKLDEMPPERGANVIPAMLLRCRRRLQWSIQHVVTGILHAMPQMLCESRRVGSRRRIVGGQEFCIQWPEREEVQRSTVFETNPLPSLQGFAKATGIEAETKMGSDVICSRLHARRAGVASHSDVVAVTIYGKSNSPYIEPEASSYDRGGHRQMVQNRTS
jgi:hypothetical protein